MADRPIIFSAPMIRALLEGRKSQTRRVLKPQPVGIAIAERFGRSSWTLTPESNRCTVDFKAPPYTPGDRLWVREAWRARVAADELPPRDLVPFNRPLWFEADRCGAEYAKRTDFGRLRSPIHMPRWASRLTLTVTDVRVQRVQEITEADARAEGVQPFGPVYSVEKANGLTGCGTSARAAYAILWNSIHGPGAWDRNDWVAAISFTVHRCNIDQMVPA